MPRVQTLTACGPIGGRGAVRIVGPTTGIHRLVGSKNWATQQLPTGSRQDSVVVPDNADRPKLHRAQGAKKRYYGVTALHQEKLTLSRLRSCCSGHSWWVSACAAPRRATTDQQTWSCRRSPANLDLWPWLDPRASNWLATPAGGQRSCQHDSFVDQVWHERRQCGIACSS